MAEIVLGIGMSHSPLLTLDSSVWIRRAQADRNNPNLTLADGRTVNYEQLVALRGEPYAAQATPEALAEVADRCQASLDRLGDELAEAAPDLIVIVGDDQDELYSPGNIPAIGIFWGDEIVTHIKKGVPDWYMPAAVGYAMEKNHVFPGDRAFARQLIEQMIKREVDVACCDQVADPSTQGFGHAFGFPVKRLFRGRSIPMIPILLNTYFPPNVMSASRCLDVGRRMRDAIENIDSSARVAVIGSGGLSHFVVEEELDRFLVDNLDPQRNDELRKILPESLLEGSSEILNWVLTAGAVSHLPLSWTHYEPVRRTPAGTGVGLAFAVWR